jgi:hypothetical protein
MADDGVFRRERSGVDRRPWRCCSWERFWSWNVEWNGGGQARLVAAPTARLQRGIKWVAGRTRGPERLRMNGFAARHARGRLAMGRCSLIRYATRSSIMRREELYGNSGWSQERHQRTASINVAAEGGLPICPIREADWQPSAALISRLVGSHRPAQASTGQHRTQYRLPLGERGHLPPAVLSSPHIRSATRTHQDGRFRSP